MEHGFETYYEIESPGHPACVDRAYSFHEGLQAAVDQSLKNLEQITGKDFTGRTWLDIRDTLGNVVFIYINGKEIYRKEDLVIAKDDFTRSDWRDYNTSLNYDKDLKQFYLLVQPLQGGRTERYNVSPDNCPHWFRVLRTKQITREAFGHILNLTSDKI